MTLYLNNRQVRYLPRKLVLKQRKGEKKSKNLKIENGVGMFCFCFSMVGSHFVQFNRKPIFVRVLTILSKLGTLLLLRIDRSISVEIYINRSEMETSIRVLQHIDFLGNISAFQTNFVWARSGGNKAILI